MSEKPLFIPLKTEYFEAFKSGDKDEEFRRASDKRWGAKHCRVGRAVTLSKGYGKYERLSAVIWRYEVLPAACLSFNDREAFWACYGEDEEMVARITLRDILPLTPHLTGGPYGSFT